MPYADARSDQYFLRLPPCVTHGNCGVRLENRQPIMCPRYSEGARQSPRPGDAGHAANQYAARYALGLRNQVQALVHPIDQIHIGPPRRPKYHAGARRNPARGVGRFVVQAQIRLHLHNGRRHPAAGQYFPQ